MKARVKATGKIVDATYWNTSANGIKYYDIDNSGNTMMEDELDFDFSYTPDYWTRLEHTYAGMAMQSYISNNVYLREIREMCKEPQEMRDLIADLSILLATTLVQKLKEKEE